MAKTSTADKIWRLRNTKPQYKSQRANSPSTKPETEHKNTTSAVGISD